MMQEQLQAGIQSNYGATNHVSNDLSNLNISQEYTGGKNLLLGKGEAVAIAHIGESVIQPHKIFQKIAS